MFAASKGHTSVIPQLLACPRVDVNAREVVSCCFQGAHRRAPLFFFVLFFNTFITAFGHSSLDHAPFLSLLQNGATALMQAVISDRESVVSQILANPRVNVNVAHKASR